MSARKIDKLGWSAMAVAGFLSLTGCGLSSSSSNPSVSISFENCSNNSNNTAGNLTGTWTATCVPWEYEDGSAISWTTDTLTFSGSTVSETATVYDIEDCTPSGEQYQVTASASSYSLGGADSSQTGYNYLNLTLASLHITPESSAQASSWNTASFCGLTSWSSGTAISVAGDDTGVCVYPSVGSTLYQFVGLGNDQGDDLYCSSPVNGAAFGYGFTVDTYSGIIASSGTSSYPTAAMSAIFSN